MNEIQQMTHS